MFDYSLFDSILDAVFVLDQETRVLYCNDAAAAFCQSSVRRLQGKVKLSEMLLLAAPEVFPLTEKSPGFSAASAFTETEFELPKAGRSGKLQFSMRPTLADQWLFYVRDVSLEEALHSKYRSELSQKERYIGELEEARRRLEDYSKNLEKIVEERTSELREVNISLDAILNSLGQGFFTFARSGICGDVSTKSCEFLLGVNPDSRSADEVLGIPESGRPQFKKWIEACFSETLPFDDLKSLGPATIPRSDGRRVSLEYHPIRREDQTVQSIVVVATDRTAEHQAHLALENERQYASMVVKYLKNRDQFHQFLRGAQVAVARLLESLRTRAGGGTPQEALRVLHTIEGEAGAFSIQDIRSEAREIQEWLEPFQRGEALWGSDLSERLSARVEELSRNIDKFLMRNKDVIQLPKIAGARSIEVDQKKLENLFIDLRRFQVPESFIRPVEEDLFFEPVESRLSHYDGLIQSIAQKLGKRVHPLKFKNGEIRIAPDRLAPLFATLVHVFRNAMDHGIEDPAEREMVGKGPDGQITVEFAQVGADLQIVISDDGRGLEAELIRQKLKEKFPTKDFSSQDDEAILQSVFLPGFSSRDEVSEFSGRGVGLDSLHEEVARLGGRVRISTQVGLGSAIEIIVPFPNQGYASLRSA